MSRLSNELTSQMFGEYSDDPFLMLVTLTHTTFDGPIYLCNNLHPVVSNGITFEAFPMEIVLPEDDGETAREVSIQFDNVSQELISELRKIDTPADISIAMVLASSPDEVQVEYGELKMKQINYNVKTIEAKLYMDSFLGVNLSSERYTPSLYPGLFK